MEIIEKYPDKPWSWFGVSKNPNITIEFIEKHIDKIIFQHLSENKFTQSAGLSGIAFKFAALAIKGHL